MTAKELRPHNEEQKDEGVQHERCPTATFMEGRSQTFVEAHRV
jgi:hypothetical protein